MKRDIGDLALFGGRPSFLRPLHVNTPNNFDRDRLYERLDWALDNRWLSNAGPLVLEFEERVAELAGTKHCVATCNATVALHLLVRAAGLTGEVLMPSLTFSATAHSVRWLGLDPVFCDIDPATGCVDPAEVEAKITDRTSAIFAVHLWGQVAAVDELTAIAERHGIPVYFDAAHAIGCTLDGKPVGGFGAAEVFSFHATKMVSAFEGGAITTDDDELAATLRGLKNFGKGLPEGHEMGGTNGKMSEASAAMGLTSLESYERSLSHNKHNYAAYESELDSIAGVRLFTGTTPETNNQQYAVVEVDEEVTGIGRDLLMQVLRAENVMVIPPIGAPACHEIEPYRRTPLRLPHTERLTARVMALPTGSTVGREQVRRVCDVIRCAVANGPAVRAGQHRSAA